MSFRPATVAEAHTWLREKMDAAQPVALRGGDSRGLPTAGRPVLRTGSLDQVLFFEPDDMVIGVNDHLYDGSQNLVTAASCTTNCLAPVVKVLLEGLGIKHGSMTTIHDVTNTQTIVDRAHKDARRARSALNSLIPTTTGSATAITMIYPELKGRLNGHAVRVPLLNASLTDCVFEVERETTEDEVNALFKAASEGDLKGILGYEERPLVSADYTNDTRSSIIDAQSTMVVNGTQVKIYAWYDNEMGYAWRLADVARLVSG